MTQEEKELLLKDLCARLPYKPRVRYYYCSIGSAAINEYSDEGYLSYQNLEDFSIYPKYGLEKTRVCNILPYLRPMSSMTKEEKNEFIHYAEYEVEESVNGRHYEYCLKDYVGTPEKPFCNYNAIDWLNAHHFDYRGLIDKGLTLEASDDMYNN